MAQPTYPIRDVLNDTQRRLDDFTRLMKTSNEELPQDQIDSFVRNLSQQLKRLKEANHKFSREISTSNETDNLEKRITAAIEILLKDPRIKKSRGNVGNEQLSLADFLSRVKEQIVNVKKAPSKVERAKEAEFDQL